MLQVGSLGSCNMGSLESKFRGLNNCGNKHPRNLDLPWWNWTNLRGDRNIGCWEETRLLWAFCFSGVGQNKCETAKTGSVGQTKFSNSCHHPFFHQFFDIYTFRLFCSLKFRCPRRFLQDLQEAWPGPSLRALSLAVPLLAIIWTYRQLPALRVDNGSAKTQNLNDEDRWKE